MTDSREYLTVRENAAMLGTKPETVRGWIESGKLKAIPVGSGTKRRHFKLSRRAIQEFEDAAYTPGPVRKLQRRRRRQQRADFVEYY